MRKIFKMDKISKNEDIYKNIFITVSGVFLALVQIYLILIFNGFDLFGFSMIENAIIRIFCQVLIQIIIFSILYIILYNIVYRAKTALWIKHNKDLWVQGIWLHIHIKNNIRIGFVDIKQNFYEVIAKGHNIDPISAEDEEHITNWSYLMGQVANNKTARDFIGYYKAHKQDKDISNDGMHALTVIEKNDGFPCIMRGNFYDTFKITDDSIDRILANEHSGLLLFFKPSKRCLEFLNAENSILENLRKLPNEPRFANEEYVKELNKIMKAYVQKA